MAEKRELIKVVCQAVVLVKDGDKILREETSQGLNCYSLEEMAEFYTSAKAEVDTINKATRGNRTQRRSQE